MPSRCSPRARRPLLPARVRSTSRVSYIPITIRLSPVACRLLPVDTWHDLRSSFVVVSSHLPRCSAPSCVPRALRGLWCACGRVKCCCLCGGLMLFDGRFSDCLVSSVRHDDEEVRGLSLCGRGGFQALTSFLRYASLRVIGPVVRYGLARAPPRAVRRFEPVTGRMFRGRVLCQASGRSCSGRS